MNTRNVIYIVGAALLLSVAVIGYLAGTSDRPIPDVLQNIAVGSLTGLVGLLVPSNHTVTRRGEGGESALTVALVVLVVVVVLVLLVPAL